MANEITIGATITCTKSGLSVSGTVSGLAITQSGAQSYANVQPVGTTTEALDISDVSTIGYLWLKNTDATNFVEFDLNTPVSSSTSFCKLLAGEVALIPTRRTTIYAKADTAEVNVSVVALEL